MVITVTLNPAMDKTLLIENLTLGTVNRVDSLRYDIGGKGINVSKVLKNFRIDSICTGFLGGIWKDIFKKELDKREIKHNFISVEGNTRTNTKIVDIDNKVYTDINEPGPHITKEELNEFIEMFRSMCQKEDIVILAGGVGPSIPKDIYGTLTAIAKGNGAKVILDAEGELLEEGIKEKPHIIKPNEHELKMLLNIEVKDKKDILKGAKCIRDLGIERVLVSLGEKGAMYVTEEDDLEAQGLKVPVKGTVGAGDSMVAALVYSMVNKLNPKETLAFAQASGAASVMLEGTEACTLEQVKSLLNQAELSIREVV